MVGGYFFISLMMLIFFDINIAIPCLFKSIFGFTCPGCGLTHAFIHLLKMEFQEAYSENNFIFIVAVAGLYFLVKDFLHFVKKENLTIITRR
jgi:hypothetical protein